MVPKKSLKAILYNFPGLWRVRWLQLWLLSISQKISPSLTDRIEGIFKNSSEIVLVQVGSNDGKVGDPIYPLASIDLRWRGLLIEPLPHIFSRLKANFPDGRFTFANVAISDSSGTVTFYYLDDQFKQTLGEQVPYYFDQIGSLNKEHVLKHFGATALPFLREQAICAVTLPEVLRTNSIGKIDLLHIDVEGYDFKVLKQLNFEVIKPKAILFEHMHLNSEERSAALSLLFSQGYVVLDCGQDYLATN